MDEQTTTDSQQDGAADIEKNKAVGILAYILFFIPIIAARDSKFAMYHANQGLALFIVAVAGTGVMMVLFLLATREDFISAFNGFMAAHANLLQRLTS